MNRFSLAVLPITSLAAGPLLAADAPQPAALQALQACRAIGTDAERLACFDKAAAALDQSVRNKEVVVLDKQDVRKTKRSLFGFTLPKLPFFGNDKGEDKEEPEFTQIESTVTSVKPYDYQKFRFTIEDGAEWETTEPMSFPPKKGSKVTIKKGLMGSYFIKFGNDRAVKGKRVG